MNVGDYIKIISFPPDRDYLEEGKIYRIFSIRECFKIETPAKQEYNFCKDCKSTKAITVCYNPNSGPAAICRCVFEKYTGEINKDCFCFNCEDKLFCAIKF